MPALGRTVFKGSSGKRYPFKVYALGTRFRNRSGIYVVGTRFNSGDGRYRHIALYVGQTEDLSQPFAAHHMADAFAAHGANCICLLADAAEDSRLTKEQDLIAGLHPVCNE